MTATLTEVDLKFIQGMKDAVAERGEHYIYPEMPDNYSSDYWHNGACVYSTITGEAACIVGLAIDKSGIGARPAYEIPAAEASAVIMHMGVSEVVAEAADSAQSKQDQGQEWGAALDTFRTHIADRLGVDVDCI